MKDGSGQAGRNRAALFVDFDNIYLGLTRIDPDAAEVFATEPARWMAWLERGMRRADAEAQGAAGTAVLVRKCYLNPKTFHKYRPYFTRAAFEVVDCPPLTAQGKTSSDIRMVMDILDALSHPTRFDEFVIMSGDADFTPVLLRLRAHDRRTVVVAVGYAAAAYLAACDRLLTDDRFIEDALGITDSDGPVRAEHRPAEGPARAESRSMSGEGPARAEPRPGASEGPARAESSPAPSTPRLLPSEAPPSGLLRPTSGESSMPPRAPMGEVDPGELLDEMAEAVYQATRTAGQLPARMLPRIYLRFPEFSASKDWLGFRGLRALTEEMVRREPRLRLIDTDAESWHLSPGPPPAEAGPEARAQALRASILRVVRAYVGSSPIPVTLASASHEALRRLGTEVVDERWGEAGSLRDLLLDAADPALLVLERDGVEILADPTRHRFLEIDESPSIPPGASIPAAIARIRAITGTPNLPPSEYAAVFQAIAEVLAERPFHLGPTSKLVRDLLAERGSMASRVAVTFVLRGIVYGGLALREAPYAWPARALGQAFLRNLLAMCDIAQLPLTPTERAEVERWILGALPAPPPPEDDAPPTPARIEQPDKETAEAD